MQKPFLHYGDEPTRKVVSWHAGTNDRYSLATGSSPAWSENGLSMAKVSNMHNKVAAGRFVLQPCFCHSPSFGFGSSHFCFDRHRLRFPQAEWIWRPIWIVIGLLSLALHLENDRKWSMPKNAHATTCRLLPSKPKSLGVRWRKLP